MTGPGRLVCLALTMACVLASPAGAQSNDDDYTPLNSRIKRDRQFPTDIVNQWQERTTAVTRARSRDMVSQFSKCIYNRSREDSLELLQKTDFGFVDFAQINLDNERALRNYGFMDCLRRVANTHGTAVQLRFTAWGLRQWLVQEAYFYRFENGPAWVQPGIVIAPRAYPLSQDNAGVRAAMDLADCVVATEPYTADFYYRTAAGSEDEGGALDALKPALGACIPQGQQIRLDPANLRAWVGEALWHAAMHNGPAAAPAAAETPR